MLHPLQVKYKDLEKKLYEALNQYGEGTEAEAVREEMDVVWVQMHKKDIEEPEFDPEMGRKWDQLFSRLEAQEAKKQVPIV